jgi:hypothetical protein
LLSEKKEKEEIFFNTLNYQYISAESAMKICNFAKEKGLIELTMKGLEISEKKFVEKHFSLFRVSKLILMIDNIEKYEKELNFGLQKTISDHRNSISILEEKDRIRLYQKLWNLSVSLFQSDSFSLQESSVVWFERCSSLLSHNESFEIAKFFRLISSLKKKKNFFFF